MRGARGEDERWGVRGWVQPRPRPQADLVSGDVDEALQACMVLGSLNEYVGAHHVVLGEGKRVTEGVVHVRLPCRSSDVERAAWVRQARRANQRPQRCRAGRRRGGLGRMVTRASSTCAAAWMIVSISSVSSTYLPRVRARARGCHKAPAAECWCWVRGVGHLMRSAESKLPFTNL